MQFTDRALFYSTRLDLWLTLPVRQCTELSLTLSGTSWPPASARCVSQGPLTRSPSLPHRTQTSLDSKSSITRTQPQWVWKWKWPKLWVVLKTRDDWCVNTYIVHILINKEKYLLTDNFNTLLYFQNHVYVTVNLEFAPSGLIDTAYTTCALKIEDAFRTLSSDVGSLFQLYQSGACPSSTSQQFVRTDTSDFLCSGYQGTQRNNTEDKTYCGN